MTKWYGVRERTSVPTDAARHIEEIRLSGYTVVPQVLDPERLRDIRVRLDDVHQVQAADIGGHESLTRLDDANVVRCLVAHDPVFVELAAHPRILALAAELLGDYFILQQQNGVINPPSRHNEQAAWHRDLPYQHFVASRPLAISTLWCIDDFNESTGGTCVVPGSHRNEACPSEEYVHAHAHGIVAHAGDVLVFDCMLFHRAGDNQSGRPRRGINQVYCLPFLKQQISLPLALGGRYSTDPLLRRLLGYDSEPSGSTLAWRRRRLEKLAG